MQAQQAIGKKLTVLGGQGYFSGPEIPACEQQGSIPHVPKPLTAGNHAQGLFDRQDFIDVPGSDKYTFPAGHGAPLRFSVVEHGLQIHKYWSSSCP